MNYELRFHVPESVDSDVQTRLERMLTKRFGGTTAYPYRGTWENENGRYVSETGDVVTSVMDTDSRTRARNAANDVHEWLQEETDESAIMSDVRRCNVRID